MTEDNISSTHPQLPPTTEEHRYSWLRLLRSRRVGVSTFYKLMAEHGCAERALEALPSVAQAAGVDNYSVCPAGVIESEMAAGRKAGARLVAISDEDYPQPLKDIADAPPLLWTLGDVTLATRPALALVGARNASSLGTRMARGLARELGEAGFVVASGLARGVDTAAHAASLKTGTIAVFGGGVDVIYPADNRELARKIADNGLIVSEQPMGTVPQARHFPARNRIISGMSQAVVVVEAAARSGSLITAREALDQGREVLAVPGHPFDARASGCNMLIRDGATLVRGAKDVIEMVGAPRTSDVSGPSDMPPQTSPSQRSLRDTSDLHMQILNRLGPAPLAEDQLIRDLSAPANRVTPVLIDLELDGRIQRQAGGLLSKI
ncbi:DNA-processing protein DprA [Shimia thalassica]|uniref:DNA-processing protein DprA n=1 Tax=Shimia thalassica TaxID=1715693 RepID=UPI00273756D9|nr:DNA-processing protein DprA [Shimia thalassica]MDP2492842.1 DNA-processing protein DprA [Shimia thalassica]MDP2578560.1 DNA-processing protein DprA [Shimia thalassica]